MQYRSTLKSNIKHFLIEPAILVPILVPNSILMHSFLFYLMRGLGGGAEGQSAPLPETFHREIFGD